MGTATHDHGTHHGKPAAGQPPEAHDPERDIDARSATIWFVCGAIALFACLWVLLPIFLRVLEEERFRKSDQIPATERIDVMEAQREFLDGANPKKKSIDQVMKELAKGK
ncbi:MAG: hypothetical protein Q7T30_04020 [Planctomycetota bacterium]|nr:hypothetical protein [Planctomycetota bacterium]